MSPKTINKLSFPQLDTPHTSLHVLFEFFFFFGWGQREVIVFAQERVRTV